MAYALLGKDFVPPDVRAKVTGSAKYAEDFRADTMGGHTFKRTPVTTGMIVNAVAGREQSHQPLQVNTA